MAKMLIKLTAICRHKMQVSLRRAKRGQAYMQLT